MPILPRCVALVRALDTCVGAVVEAMPARPSKARGNLQSPSSALMPGARAQAQLGEGCEPGPSLPSKGLPAFSALVAKQKYLGALTPRDVPYPPDTQPLEAQKPRMSLSGSPGPVTGGLE